MKRWYVAVMAVVVLALGARVDMARAEMAAGEHRNGGLGFHTVDAPIGVRWWLNGQKIGIDAGIGFGQTPSAPDPDEKLMNWTVDFGVPIVMHSWERVHVMFRPGLTYSSQEEVTSVTPTFETDDRTQFDVNAEIEGELFLANNFSISASHGLRFSSVSPSGGGDSRTSFGTFGNNFTNVGFHIYFLGGSQ